MRALLMIALLCASTLPAADFGGTWLGRIATTLSSGAPDGAFQEVAFKLIQKGSALEGKLYGVYQSSPITEGKISGDEISFAVIAPEQQGNQIVETKLRFTGRFNKDGEIEMTRVRESSTNAGNSGAFSYRVDNTKQTFRLKRLL
jgi:hypothetical protein